MGDGMHDNMFQCKYCNQLIELTFREFVLMAESTSIQYFESCCMLCADENGFTIIRDPAMRQVLTELSSIVGHEEIRLAAPGSSINQHGVGPEDLEGDITDTTQPHRPTRKTDNNDAKRFYRGIMREIRELRGKQAEMEEEAITSSQARGHRCKSNEESEQRFPIRSSWKPSEVPDSIGDYWNKRKASFEHWAKLKLQPDGTFKEPEEK